jgi:hypothetical protein
LSIKVRDRLMHPRIPMDVDISTKEVADALRAYKGFNDLLMKYPPKVAKATRRTPPTHLTTPLPTQAGS